ncbi:MAG TPA: alpha-amylase family protein, partial [Chryseolinea sp.]|nr:alpha-amylase family protein [Chryseolinea sp.]
YVNPYMKKNMLGDVIEKCHANGIKVITRFDFSRAHESIFKKHPDWFHVSPKGERIINDDMYVVSIDAPYEQQVLFEIVEEVIENYAIDGIFINMPGYQTRNSYVGVYHGIDQNEYSRKRFAEFSQGMTLPTDENVDDPAFRKYQEFKKYSVDDLMKRLKTLVKSKNKQIAICTYGDRYIDIIRHESQTNSLPYWPYVSSDNVSNAKNSYPDHIISNASIQQISFQSRYNAVEPEETVIRLYENIANGSGLDMSLMGDFQDYEDERNFDAFKRVYQHHKKYEPYFGKYFSPATIAVIAPGAWPSGEAAQEYRGIQLMLKESHLQYDIVEDGQIENLEQKLSGYKLIILPEITNLSDKAIEVIKRVCDEGANIIATNRSFSRNPEALLHLFGAKIIKSDHPGDGFYLSPQEKELFKRFDKQTLLFWKFNLGLYDFSASDTSFLPIYTPGRPGPPEIIGGHEPSGYQALAIKEHPSSKAAILPINLGKLYFLHGYEQHKNILLDLIDYLYPEANDLIETNAHERVEVILQKFVKNVPENISKSEPEGMILHLVNLTGFSGNTYFAPIPLTNLDFAIKLDFKPVKIRGMVHSEPIDFTWTDGFVKFSVKELGEFEGVVLER